MRNITLWPWWRFIRAWFLTFTLASMAHTQFNIWQLGKVDIAVSLNQRIAMTGQDWLGLLPSYGVIIAGGLLLGWLICAVIFHFTQARSTLVKASFILAGGITIGAIHTAMYPILQVTLIAGARDFGLLLQILCGLIGACWFVYPIKSRPLQYNSN
jgi:hypothetical protein